MPCPGCTVIVDVTWASEVKSEELLLCAFTVKVNVPALVGVPVRRPAEFRFSPSGRVPDSSVVEGCG